MGATYFVVSSDYPHSDGAFPDAMNEFFGMPAQYRAATQDLVGELRPPLRYRDAAASSDGTAGLGRRVAAEYLARNYGAGS